MPITVITIGGGGSSSGGGASPTIAMYTHEFSAETNETITAATQTTLAANKNKAAFVYLDGTPNESVNLTITVADNGDVTWTTSPLQSITGHMVIIGAPA